MARVFVGMGDAMVFISLLRLVALWFPPGRTAMITQVTGVLGQLGALASAAPLALALSAWGWTPPSPPPPPSAWSSVWCSSWSCATRRTPATTGEELEDAGRRPRGAAGLG